MMDGGAFGGGKAGAPFDPLAFLKKPNVVLRILSLLFSIIVFGCISSEGWQNHQEEEGEMCIMNGSNTACNFGSGVAIIAFLASIGFLVGEYFFEQMSSVKSRKHFVLGDMGFSGLWGLAYLVSFCTMAHQWSQSEDPPAGVGTGNVRATIFFSFLSIFTWVGCAFLGWQRHQAGCETAFTNDPEAGGDSYQAGYEQSGYAEPPFQQQQGGDGQFEQIQY